jgi:hypothetical protein
MSGFEVIGVVLAVPAVVEQLLNVCLAGYGLFRAAQSVGKDVQDQIHDLDVSRQALEDWIRELASCGDKLESIIEPNTFRYELILRTLAMIASVFTEVEQLEKKYGISCVDREAQGADANREVKMEVRVDELSHKSKSSSKLPSLKGASRNFRSLFKAPKSKKKDSGSEESRTLASLARGSPSISGRTTPALDSYADLEDVPDLPEYKLEAHVPGLDGYINKMTLKAAEYQKTIPTLKRYEWACANGEQLGRLVRDLQKYVTHLRTLTRYPIERK